jgi:hypothetical protein
MCVWRCSNSVQCSSSLIFFSFVRIFILWGGGGVGIYSYLQEEEPGTYYLVIIAWALQTVTHDCCFLSVGGCDVVANRFPLLSVKDHNQFHPKSSGTQLALLTFFLLKIQIHSPVCAVFLSIIFFVVAQKS